MKKLLQTSFIFFFFLLNSFGQKWICVDNTSFKSQNQQRVTIPKNYDSYELNYDTFVDKLKNAPDRFRSKEEGISIQWPMPDNKFQEFTVKRSDVFHPDLAAKYPAIRAYTGYSSMDPTAILKISVSHKGIEGMLLSNRHETIYLDRYLPKSKNQYILYKRSDYHRDLLEHEGKCTVEVPDDGYVAGEIQSKFGDCMLRKFRLALACTGEYATFHGGNIPDVLAEYNASMVRVNGIYERDFTITMELIPNTDELIFLEASTDPYTNNNGGSMLGQNQATIDQIIGTANYDIGHVYSTGGGGIASLRSPCTNRKARGVTGLNNPTGDFFWVDYVAHEMGHQFGGNHTFNNSCNNNRNNSTAIEPGSGATIMAYAGICSPNVQNNSDDYFHSISQGEVANFVVAGQGNCAEIIPIDNNSPEIISITPSGHILPVSTPFMLTAEATDPDGDLLTYCWEQIDHEIATMPPQASATTGPAFRSFDPEEAPTRLFPSILPILFGLTATTWEVLPSTDRDMEFNLTVRDNHPLAGCTADETLSLSFTSSAGPFKITSQNAATTWNAGEMETITWDVANTDLAPVSCENVDIVFSLDRGENFDVIIAENIPNDGEHEIIVPFQFTSQGRIMIKCSSSIFFDINDRDINLIAPFSMEVTPDEIVVCPDQVATYELDYTVFSSDPVPVNFSLNGLPVGATYSITPDSTDTDTMVVLTIDNLTNDLAGTYNLEVIAMGDVVTQTQNVSLIVAPDQNQPVSVLSPADGQIGISISPVLSWEMSNGISEYEVEVAMNPNFQTIAHTQTVNNTFTTVSNLNPMTVYYWRVRAVSPCLPPEWDNTLSFQTNGILCQDDTSSMSVIIPSNQSGTVESEIIVESQGSIGDLKINVNIAHSYIGDLSATITAPNGVEVDLFDRPGVPATNFGCDADNIVVTFSDSAENTADDFENTCSTMGNAIEGEFRPQESFALLNNSPTNGVWTLTIMDAFEDDGGELTDWTVTTCQSTPLDPGMLIINNILQLDNTVEGFITNTHLIFEDSNEETDLIAALAMVRSLPEFGSVSKWSEEVQDFIDLEIGDTFSQSDVNNNRIKYTLLDIEADDDSFLFDAVDAQSRYTSNNLFNITATIAPLSISATIIDQISCFGEMDGRIDVMGLGGIPGYTFSINGGAFESQSSFENLGAGEYTIAVRDDIGTEVFSDVLTIIEPAQITFVHFLGDNEITIGAQGGTGAYMYSLDGINYTSESTIEIFDGETYRIFVKDENGCITESFMESTFYQIGSADISTVDIFCKGDSTGSITINSVSGGLAPYNYQLNDDSPVDQVNFTDLIAGIYTIKINDSLGNSLEISVELTEPEFELGISSTVFENTITLEGSGGSGMYLYSINGLDFTDNNTFENLPDGEYVGYIVDSNSCEVSQASIIVNTATSNPSLDLLELFPNPAFTDFTLGSNNIIKFEYEIIDISGKVITRNIGSSNAPISVEHLPSGLFLIKVNHEKSFKVFKLSKI